jgi:(R,R)-butanediol dehydrogenase/meso-butanediol dehydrogenase/diacetyl reductase
VRGDKAHPLRDEWDLRQGACVEPVATAWHAVKAVNFQAGQTALVVGAGPVGIFAVKVLLAFGAR